MDYYNNLHGNDPINGLNSESGLRASYRKQNEKGQEISEGHLETPENSASVKSGRFIDVYLPVYILYPRVANPSIHSTIRQLSFLFVCLFIIKSTSFCLCFYIRVCVFVNSQVCLSFLLCLSLCHSTCLNIAKQQWWETSTSLHVQTQTIWKSGESLKCPNNKLLSESID